MGSQRKKNMKIEPDFKAALAELPEKKKDKLLVRLLRKDKVLMQKLYFELVSVNTAEDERNLLADRIIQNLKNPRIVENYHDWMWEIRSLSGAITLHLKVTGDKVGEVSLTILLLQTVLAGNTERIHKLTPKNALKLAKYLTGKLYKIVVLIQALHEDLRIEFNEELEELGKLWQDSDYLLRYANSAGCQIEWFLEGEFPDNIKERMAAARKRGEV